VIESRAQIMNHVSANDRRLIYDGFVVFGEGGSLAGLGVCLDNVGEGAIFAEQFVQIYDVFRGPINL
jgi:hypothetical protein